LVTEKIAQAVEAFFEEQGWKDCYIVDIIHKGKSIEVYADRDGGINLETCHKISRAIESFLDTTGLVGEDYILDVSSPGVGTPLKLARQYANNIGREVEIKIGDSIVTGKITKIEDNSVTISYIEKRKEGKKNIKEEVEKTIEISSIKSAKIKVSFK
jgi:ribosome maturation factor RimP